MKHENGKFYKLMALLQSKMIALKEFTDIYVYLIMNSWITWVHMDSSTEGSQNACKRKCNLIQYKTLHLVGKLKNILINKLLFYYKHYTIFIK